MHIITSEMASLVFSVLRLVYCEPLANFHLMLRLSPLFYVPGRISSLKLLLKCGTILFPPFWLSSSEDNALFLWQNKRWVAVSSLIFLACGQHVCFPAWKLKVSSKSFFKQQQQQQDKIMEWTIVLVQWYKYFEKDISVMVCSTQCFILM